mmetsp:Transcript_13141/g.22219  ORF Transcript_13141/g.22219 Transcript_13141/m.22219 type:complete len:349 (-) Transcript_13141:104-1150(-)
MACTLFVIVSSYIRYDIWLQWSKSIQKYTQYDNLINTGVWKSLFFEILVNIVAPYPFLDGVKYVEIVKDYDTQIEYEVNDILLFCSFSRTYMIVNFLVHLTQFRNTRAQRVCSINGCDANTMFSIKAIMKQRPYIILFSSLVITTLIFGFQLRLFEHQLNEISGQNFSNMYNSMWNVIITLTSVGYGEIFPKTFFGRVVGVMISFWGVLIVSFFVVTVSNILNFNASELKAFDLLIRLFYKLQLKKEAIGVLQSAFIHRNAQINSPDNKAEILSHFSNFRSHMLQFQQTAKHVRSFNEKKQDIDIMQNILESLIESIDDLRQQQELTIQNVDNTYKLIMDKEMQNIKT